MLCPFVSLANNHIQRTKNSLSLLRCTFLIIYFPVHYASKRRLDSHSHSFNWSSPSWLFDFYLTSTHQNWWGREMNCLLPAASTAYWRQGLSVESQSTCCQFNVRTRRKRETWVFDECVITIISNNSFLKYYFLLLRSPIPLNSIHP